MSPEPTKKTLRYFYCGDSLWQVFERMSEKLDRGVDDLINESMRALATSRGFGADETSESKSSPVDRESMETPVIDEVRPRLGGTGRASASSSDRTDPTTSARKAIPQRPLAPPLPAPQPARIGLPPPPPARSTALRQDSAAPSMDSEGTGQALYLIFENQRHKIDKEQFVIGRGSKSTDLPIKDGNISRKHAAVVRRNGTYFIRDLGSTNGIDFNGTRIDNKRIDEGDVFHLCEYELKFTYRR